MKYIILTVIGILAMNNMAIAVENKNSIDTFTLDNGLEIVVIPDRRAEVATHMLWYRVGAADEMPKQSGIAHYLEHLMFKGTKNVEVGEFSRLVSQVGGQENAFTGDDYTGYFQRIPPKQLKKMMELEADRMTNLTLTNEDVETERGVILEERNSRTDNNPTALFGEAMNAALFRNHPYAIPIIGWKHEIEKITKEQILKFYKTHYAPNNAVLVVAGDVDANEVLKMAKQTYGKIKKSDEIQIRNRATEPPSLAARRVNMQDERVTTPLWQRYYLVPSYQTSEDGPALDVLSEILGGGTTSRLYQRLIIQDKIATFANAWYRGSRLNDTTFTFSAAPTPDNELSKIEMVLDEVVDELVENGVEKHEVERAQKRLVRAAVFAQDSQETLARIYGTALALGGSVENVEKWSEDIKKVNVEDVKRVAQQYLRLERSVTGTLETQE